MQVFSQAETFEELIGYKLTFCKVCVLINKILLCSLVPDMTARIVFRVSFLALLLYSAVTQKCPAGGRSESSIVGWMLRGHVYDTLLAELPFTCVFKCREENRCQSFNWVISLLTCEFNNRTKEARPEDFIPNQDRSYYPRDLRRGKPSLSARGNLIYQRAKKFHCLKYMKS